VLYGALGLNIFVLFMEGVAIYALRCFWKALTDITHFGRNTYRGKQFNNGFDLLSPLLVKTRKLFPLNGLNLRYALTSSHQRASCCLVYFIR